MMMYALLKKELTSFFGSFTGYLILIVFLVITGLFLWIFSGEFNILTSGYASIEGLFIIAPWVFLFLLPALSMRFFSEEMKTGTMELLLTMPLTDKAIVCGKYCAGLILLTCALIPTALYYVTVYALGSPVGNIDTGATIGAYIGLFFIGGMYLSIGTFISSLTDNQIVAFVLSAIVCFVFYIGFDFIAETVSALSWLSNIGINQHYTSISRGVIDTRDIVYFVAFIAFFIYCTTLSIARKRK